MVRRVSLDRYGCWVPVNSVDRMFRIAVGGFMADTVRVVVGYSVTVPVPASTRVRIVTV